MTAWNGEAYANVGTRRLQDERDRLAGAAVDVFARPVQGDGQIVVIERDDVSFEEVVAEQTPEANRAAAV